MSPIRAENKGRYPADWPAISRAIRERAGQRCEWCGVPNYAVGHRAADGTFVPGRGAAPQSYAEARDLLQREVEWDHDLGDTVRRRWIIVVLTVAHLNHRPEDVRPEGLACLCQRCHNRHDARERQRGIRERRAVRELPLFSEVA